MHQTTRSSSVAPRGLRIFVCLLLVAAFTPVFTAQAVDPLPLPPIPGTYYVDVATGDDVNTGGESDPFKSISKAAGISFSGSTIIVAPGTYTSSETTSSGEEFPIAIREGVTLKSSGGSDVTVVDAEWDNTVFTIDGFGGQEANAETTIEILPVTVEGLTVTRGAEQPAGGFYIDGVDVTLRDVVITECYSVMGGGIHAENSELKLEDCVLEHNGWDPGYLMEADVDPPSMAINEEGGALFAGGCIVTAERTSFNENAAVFSGAAVLTEETIFTATDCSFYGNYITAEGEEGQGVGADSSWNESTWESNAVETDQFPMYEGDLGGAIAAWGPNLIDVDGTEFIDNGSPWGGAIGASPWTDVSVTGSEFFGNFAIWGSDIVQGYFGEVQEAGIEIPEAEGSVVTDEVFMEPSMFLDQCVFEDGYAMASSIISMETSSTIQNCLFDNNDVGFATIETGMMPMPIPMPIPLPQESVITDTMASAFIVINSTFADNAATVSVAGHPFGDTFVYNSIFWGNGDGEMPPMDLRSLDTDEAVPPPLIDGPVDVLNAYVTYSDLEYGAAWDLFAAD